MSMRPNEPATALARFLPPWWLFLVTGIGWMLVALIVLRFDYASVTAVAVLFGCVAIAAGSVETAVMLVTSGWWRLLHGFLAVVFFAAGIVAFIHPGGTFVALAAVISFYFVFAGTIDIVTAISARRELEAWWLPLVGGILELVLGFWAAGNWGVSAVLLVAWTAAAAVIRGVRDVVLALRLREIRSALEAPRSAAEPVAPRREVVPGV